MFRQSRNLTPAFGGLFYNALIQPHFDYGWLDKFFFSRKIWKSNFKTLETNKYIHFYLNRPPRSHINPLHFRRVNCLPANDSVENCIANTVFKYWNRITARKMKFSIKDFFSKCDQICSFLRIWSHLLKKSSMENFIFCAVRPPVYSFSRFEIILS